MYSTILELAISMILLYLMLSAACSAIQEIIANMLRWRAKTLEKGIEGLFLSRRFKDELYKHPLIASLCSPNARGQISRKPSYIPSATFALAVLKVATDNNIIAAEPAAVPAAVPVPPPGGPVPPAATPANDPFARPAELLKSLLLGAASVDEQRKRIEDWFNDSMDRVSGWYKRTSNAWLWIIGFVLCLLVNADSISLANAFWNDSTLRAAMVAAANEEVRNPTTPLTTTSGNTTPSGGSSGAAGTAATGNQPSISNDDAFNRLNKVRKELAKVSVPLGWCWKSGDKKTCFPKLETADTTAGADALDPRMIIDPDLPGSPNPCVWWLLKLLGIVLTGLAISQGAPFWFDLLQKAVNLRLAGDAPDEKKQNK